MQYTEDRPVVDVVAANDANRADELFTSGLLTKSTEWAYEQEYRITRGKGSGLVPFPPQALTGVILGGRASRKNKKAVVELLSKRPLPVRLLRVVFEEESFALHLEEV